MRCGLCSLNFVNAEALADHLMLIIPPWKGKNGKKRGRKFEGETYCDRIKEYRRNRVTRVQLSPA